MKKRRILCLFPLLGLLLAGCDAQEIVDQFGGNIDVAKDWVVNTVTGKETEKPEEQQQEEEQGQHEEEVPPVVIKDFEGLSLESESVHYDGMAHKLEVAGELPAGATISYGEAGNEFIELGEYKVEAEISAEGYNTLKLEATLTILPGILEGITLEDETVIYDGQPHSISVTGNLPEGATVNYGAAGNEFKYPGEHKVKAVVSCPNYEDLVLTATLTILAGSIEGVIFESATFTFDGAYHEIAPVIPEEYKTAKVTYSEGGNRYKTVGEHEITATVSMTGYTSWVGTATLTILPADFEGLSLEDATVAFNGQKQTIALTGELPEGARFVYEEGYEGGTNPGVYEIRGTVKAEGYNDLALSATLTIVSEAAENALMVADFEGLTANDLADDFELKFYNNGWVDPSAAKLEIAKNQVFGEGEQTMKMVLTHQGSAFKVTKDLNRDYKKYSGFAIDTMMDSHAQGGTMKVQVQFWFKDLPLPEAYSGYANTYVTYTLANNAPSTWTHWEIPFTDESLSIASGAIQPAMIAQLGYTMEELSIYFDKVAVIITPNYVNGQNCYAYIDNIELTRGTEKKVEQYVPGGRYGALVNDSYLALDMNSDLTAATFSADGQQVAELIVEKSGQMITFKDKDYAGAGLTVEALIELDGSLKVNTLSGQAAANLAFLEGLTFAKHASMNYDLQDHKSEVGKPLEDKNWYQEKWDKDWLEISDSMNVRNSGENVFANMVTGYYMDYRYTFTNAEELGLANHFSIDLGNDFSGCADIKLKIKLVTTDNKEVFVIGSASEYAVVPANTAKFTHFEAKDFGEINVRSVVVTVKSTRGASDYLYFDNLKVEFAKEEPVEIYTLTDGEFALWNGASDAYKLTLSDSLTSASVTKYGSEDSYAMSVAVSENEIVVADQASQGAGLKIIGQIGEKETITVTSVEGAMGSAFQASLVNKTFKKVSNTIALDFSDGTTDANYKEAHWQEQYYGSNGWTSYVTPTQMRSKVDKNGNKVVNFAVNTMTYNFLYTPDHPIGPVNHFEIDLGNYFSGTSGAIMYKIALLGSDGNVARYMAGDANNFASIAKDTSQGNLLVKQTKDFDLTYAYAVRITVKMSSGSGYLYADNLKVSYKAPEPTVPTMSIVDGDYYIWNGSSDAFTLNISNNLTKGSVRKIGSDAYDMDVSVTGNTVVIKDSQYGGQGLKITASIIDTNKMKVTAVEGQLASALSGSLLNKEIKHSEPVSLDFEDGAGSGSYSGAHWSGEKYVWDSATQTGKWEAQAILQMNSRYDKAGSKIVNCVATSTTYNFIYTPDVTMGPINHLSIDLGNYFSSSKDIQYKISILDVNGNATYVAGDANNFATLAHSSSTDAVLSRFEFDFALTVGYKIRITTKASANSYFYMDNLSVSCK